MEWLITIAILTPAIWLALARSSWLIDYAFVVLAFNRGLRRIVDYYFNHAFNPLSPISLTPLVICALLMVPFLSRFRTLMLRVKAIFWLFFVAAALGLGVGIIQNGFAALFQFTEYLAPLALCGFAATANAIPQVTDRWIKSAGWTGVAVAAYGWFQYFNPPVWDALWMEQTGMIGYLGIPEPTQIIVFSTMQERGPLAVYLAAMAIPMIIAARWRNWTGWLSAAFVLSIIPLSTVRTALIGVALVVVINPMVNRGRGVLAITLSGLLVFVGVVFGADRLPNSEQVLARYQTLGNLADDSSFQGRFDIARSGFEIVATHPFGFGFGGSGMAGRVNTRQVSTGAKFGDNGYVLLLLDYGWLGGLLYFSALWLIWKEMARRFHSGVRDEYISLSRSWFLAMLVLNYVANFYTGPSLFWVFIGVALSSKYDPQIRRLLAERAAKKGLLNPKTCASVSIGNTPLPLA